MTKLQNQPVSHREKITGELEDIIDKIVCQTSIAEFNISQKTMEQAINLIDYFNKHMLLISNYNLSDCSIEEFIDKTINNSSN